jgi:hypothetical protein
VDPQPHPHYDCHNPEDRREGKVQARAARHAVEEAAPVPPRYPEQGRQQGQQQGQPLPIGEQLNGQPANTGNPRDIDCQSFENSSSNPLCIKLMLRFLLYIHVHLFLCYNLSQFPILHLYFIFFSSQTTDYFDFTKTSCSGAYIAEYAAKMKRAEALMATLTARGVTPEDMIAFGVSEELVRGVYPEAGSSR